MCIHVYVSVSECVRGGGRWEGGRNSTSELIGVDGRREYIKAYQGTQMNMVFS